MFNLPSSFVNSQIPVFYFDNDDESPNMSVNDMDVDETTDTINEFNQKEKTKYLTNIQQIKKNFDSLIYKYGNSAILNNFKQYEILGKTLEEFNDYYSKYNKNIDLKILKECENCLNLMYNNLIKLLDNCKKQSCQQKPQSLKPNNKEDVNMVEEDEEWINCGAYTYYGQNLDSKKAAQLNVKHNKNKSLLRFDFLFYKNMFDIMLRKDYKIVNQYFESKGLDPLMNDNKIYYVEVLKNPQEQINKALKYLNIMVDGEEDFKKFIQFQPNHIKKGIEAVQRFINMTLENYADVHDFKFCFKNLFNGYLKHEYVDKNSLDFLLIYVPLNDLKKKYNNPEIWKFENFDFGF